MTTSKAGEDEPGTKHTKDDGDNTDKDSQTEPAGSKPVHHSPTLEDQAHEVPKTGRDRVPGVRAEEAHPVLLGELQGPQEEEARQGAQVVGGDHDGALRGVHGGAVKHPLLGSGIHVSFIEFNS